MWWMAYGTLTLATLAYSFRSRETVLLQLAMILASTWVITVLSNHFLLAYIAPRILIPTDVLAAIATAHLASRARSLPALRIFIVFLTMCAVHLVAFALGQQETNHYRTMLSALYLLQHSLLLTPLLIGDFHGWHIGSPRWLRIGGLRRVPVSADVHPAQEG